VSQILVASADDVIEQIVVQCWLFEARGGDLSGARARAEKTLERLLSKGLHSKRGPSGGLLLDPYAANNTIKSRVGEPADEAWDDWLATTRRNAVSLNPAPHVYELTLRREWHAYAATAGRPLVFRLPLPLRQQKPLRADLRLIEPAGALLDRRDGPGRVELRLDPSTVRGPVIAELTVPFVGGEVRHGEEPSAALGATVGADDELWLREREGAITPSPGVSALASTLAAGRATSREFVDAAWHWLITNLRFGDVHRSDLDAGDVLESLLRSRLADCVLGSSLLIAMCRSRGIPARLVSGFLLHPANLGPHAWAEVRLGPGRWIPFDFGSWCYCAGDPDDPLWGHFFRGRVDARFVAEVAPREFTGWGSAAPPEAWYRLERLRGDLIEHTLHALADGSLVRRDLLGLRVVGPESS
jgi:Transglutaminase-like superfamily